MSFAKTKKAPFIRLYTYYALLRTCVEDGGRKLRRQDEALLPTMSFRICSVIGMGLEASGDTYFVKILTASRSIPIARKKKKIICESQWLGATKNNECYFETI